MAETVYKSEKFKILFDQGFTPAHDEVQALGKELGVKTNAIGAYFSRWVKRNSPKATEENGNGKKPSPPSVYKATPYPEKASVIHMAPKEFRMTAPQVLYIARDVAIREWNWPADMSMDDFVEHYFSETLKILGYIPVSYVRMSDLDDQNEEHQEQQAPESEAVNDESECAG